MLPQRSEAVVIGGGVMGAAALHYLVELGCREPVLLERETLASGSTGHCAGGVRTLFSDELNVRIGVESIERLQRFEAEVGVELDLRLFGYLFLLDDPERRLAVPGRPGTTGALRARDPDADAGGGDGDRAAAGSGGPPRRSLVPRGRLPDARPRRDRATRAARRNVAR